MDISVVVPVYGCPEALHALHDRLTNTLSDITTSYEIIFVNDGCPKGSWLIIQKICKEDKKVIGVNLSRNFGQIHATNAGLSLTKGKYVVLLDCDLQDPPEAIKELYTKINEGYDIVFAKRKDRIDTKLTIWFSKTFYKLYNSIVDGHYDGEICNYCIAKRKIVDEYNAIKDHNKCYTTLLCWMGYRNCVIPVECEERFSGKSSYNLRKKINLAIDMIISQSNKPLYAVIELGVFVSIMSFIYLLYRVIVYFTSVNNVEGWTSIIGAIFLMGGLTLISLGIVGLYIGNIYVQSKEAPEYLIDTILNEKKTNTKNKGTEE